MENKGINQVKEEYLYSGHDRKRDTNQTLKARSSSAFDHEDIMRRQEELKREEYQSYFEPAQDGHQDAVQLQHN